MTKPVLKYVACHRGESLRALRAEMAVFPLSFERIQKGPLKGCLRREDARPITVLRLSRGAVLEFRVCIRVDYP